MRIVFNWISVLVTPTLCLYFDMCLVSNSIDCSCFEKSHRLPVRVRKITVVPEYYTFHCLWKHMQMLHMTIASNLNTTLKSKHISRIFQIHSRQRPRAWNSISDVTVKIRNMLSFNEQLRRLLSLTLTQSWERARERESERFYWRFNATKRDATEAHIIHGYTCQGWRNPKERLKKEEVIQLLTHSRKRLPKNSFIADANLEHLDVCLRPARRMSN